MPSKVKLFVDSRDLRSHVPTELESLGAEVIIRQLDVGDYILSERVGVERKASEDFLSTLIDRRELFHQIHDLATSYDIPLLIIEGLTDEIFTLRRIHPNAILGLLDTIAVSFRVPILYTLNPKETAFVLFNIAQKEQREYRAPFQPHGKKTNRNPDEQLEYTLSSIPDVGTDRARYLLKHFGSVQAVANAEQEDLQEVPLVGDVMSAYIYEFFRRAYSETPHNVR